MARSKTTQKCPEGNTKTSGRFRLFCYTAYCEAPLEIISRYHCYGKETCPTTGRHHWQGFVYWDNPKTLSAVIKILKPHHVEVCKGTLEENENYCKKAGIYTEVGERPNQGARSDLFILKLEVMEGRRTVDEITVSQPWMYHSYGRTLEKLEDIYMRQQWRTEMTTCDWLVGPTGVGKSHRAHDNYSPETHYIVRDDIGWWEGYKQQPIVIINEFRGELKFKDLLQLIDKWPYFVRRRNREPVPFTSKHVIITSPKRPEEVYYNIADDTDSIDQLLRRVNIIELNNPPDDGRHGN